MIAVILGTRPEIIKMSPVIEELRKRRVPHLVVHTGQHYSFNMDRIFFEELNLPQPEYNLEVGSGTHAEETGKAMIRIESVLLKKRPDIVLVEGDTNTVLAGSLSACKTNFARVGHIEAGLRSFDRTMPEEINRILTDHVSDYLFAPTEISRQNLVREGISDDKILITGNTIVDVILQQIPRARQLTPPAKGEYALLTLHRQENVDRMDRLERILQGLTSLARRFDLQVIYPVHPRTRKKINDFGIHIDKSICLLEPCGYLIFLRLIENARLILTDSGGVQEEACVLNVPCVTLRDNTERPETLMVGSNVLAGTDPGSIVEKATKMINSPRRWRNPFGDGKAAVRIVDAIA